MGLVGKTQYICVLCIENYNELFINKELGCQPCSLIEQKIAT